MVAILGRVLMLGGALCLGSPAKAAESLPDPTRPPSLAATVVQSDKAQRQAGASQGLKSIRISPGQRSAVINGRTVEQGGRIGNEVLVEVRASSVLLQGPQARRVLELYPGVSLRQAAMPPQARIAPTGASGVAAVNEKQGTGQTRMESQ